MTFAHKIKANVGNVADRDALFASNPDEQAATDALFVASPRVLALGLDWDEGVAGGVESIYPAKVF